MKFHTWTQLTIASDTSVFLSIDQEKEKHALGKTSCCIWMAPSYPSQCMRTVEGTLYIHESPPPRKEEGPCTHSLRVKEPYA